MRWCCWGGVLGADLLDVVLVVLVLWLSFVMWFVPDLAVLGTELCDVVLVVTVVVVVVVLLVLLVLPCVVLVLLEISVLACG